MEREVVTQQVEIFGQTYVIKSAEDPQLVRDVAAFVDKRMREVAEQVPTVDLAKIAILTALNISDEFYRFRSKVSEGDPGRYANRAERLVAKLDEILKSSPGGGAFVKLGKESSGTLRGT